MSYDDLIARVRHHPHLYTPAHRYYKSRSLRMRTWRVLAEELNCNDILLRKRWKHLKDKYRKELKKIKAKNNGQIPKNCTSVWPMFEKLHFLRDDVMYRDRMKAEEDNRVQEQFLSETDISDLENHSTMDNEEVKVKIEPLEHDGAPAAKDAATIISEAFQNPLWPSTDMSMLDPDLLFLVSLLPSMKTLTELQKMQFRGKVNDLLLEAMSVNECSPQMFMQQQMLETELSETRD